ncbi:MAG: ABC transporter substrate-binding protein [Dehalococcoidia bacterium]
MKKIIYVAAVMAIFSMLLPACTAGQQSHAAKGTFTEAQLGGDAQTLNWVIATDGGASKRYASFMVDPLAVFDNQFKLQLRCLAKDIEVSSDGLVYTVTIRGDLRWADGSSVKADDYVYTLKNIMLADWLQCADKSKWQETVDNQTYAVSPERLSDTSFKIVRRSADSDFLYTIYDLIPYPKFIATHYENKKDQFTAAPEFVNMNYSGNMGAYLPTAWNATDGFVMARNPDYYLGKDTGVPYFEKYVIKAIGLQSLINEGLTAGQISSAYIEPNDANTFRSQGKTTVYTVPTGYYVYIAYNQRDNGWAGLKDARVRQALSMVIDKPAVIQLMYQGFAVPAFSFIPPYSPWYDESVLNKYGMNPASDRQKAIDLIKSAGYEQKEVEGKMVFVDKDGNPIKLSFPVDMGSDFEQNLAIVIRQNLLGIGLDITPKFSPRDMLYAGLMNKVPGSSDQPSFNNGPKAVGTQPWDLAILSSHSNPLALGGSSDFFSSTGKFNLFGYFNDKVDALYQRARSAEGVSPQAHKQLYTELSKTVSDDQPVDFLVFYSDNYAFQSNVKGVEPGPNMLYNYQFWYFQ